MHGISQQLELIGVPATRRWNTRMYTSHVPGAHRILHASPRAESIPKLSSTCQLPTLTHQQIAADVILTSSNDVITPRQ